MWWKTLVGKTLLGEFQVIILEISTNKKKQLQAQETLPYKTISKYLYTVKPTNLYQYQLQSTIEPDLVENFSFARISISITNSISIVLIVVTFCCSFTQNTNKIFWSFWLLVLETLFGTRRKGSPKLQQYLNLLFSELTGSISGG